MTSLLVVLQSIAVFVLSIICVKSDRNHEKTFNEIEKTLEEIDAKANFAILRHYSVPVSFEEVKNPVFKNSVTVLPTRGTKESAGYDFSLKETITIEPGKMIVTATDVKCGLPDGFYLNVVPRSSIGIKKHIMLANTVGVIDSDYFENKDNDGNILLALYNYGENPVTLVEGQRVAQGIVTPFGCARMYEEVAQTRDSGIGSTDM